MSLHLLKTSEKIALTPLIALIGPEVYVRRELREALIRRALGAGLREMNYSSFQAGEDEMAKVVDACRDYPCFSEKRVVLLREPSRLRKKEVPELLSYFENPVPSTLFLLEDEKLDGRLDWVKLLKKQSQWIETSEASPRECLQWIQSCFQTEGKKAESEVRERLLEWIGVSLGGLKITVTQLCLFVGDSPQVTLKDLETLLVKVTEENIFEVVDQIFAGNIRECHRSLGALLEGGEAPLKILALVYRHLAILLTLKDSRNSKGSELLRMPPMFRQKYEVQTQRFGSKLHLGLLAPVARADLQLKLSPLDKSLILKNCVEEMIRLLGHTRHETRQARSLS